MAGLNAEQLRRLARLGAVTRLEQLHEEEAAIRAEFPELFGGARARGARHRQAVRRTSKDDAGTHRRTMSAEARKAAAAGMRRIWAERRKAAAPK